MTRPTLSLTTSTGLEIPAISIVFSASRVGAWFVDADLDVGGESLPSGKVTVRISGETLRGTVEAAHSGRFGAHMRVRVVGGANGWQKPVRAQHWHSDGGVPLSRVLLATAAEVGETIGTVGADEVLGTGPWREAGPASSVLAGRAYYVDAAGITHVGPRPEVAAPADLVLLEYDATTTVGLVSSVTLPWPGWRITDAARTNPIVVHAVEATYSGAGARVQVRGGAAGAEDLYGMIAVAMRSALGVPYVVRHRYRVVGLVGDRLEVQRTTPTAPDVSVVEMRPGVAGIHAPPVDGAEVVLGFLDGNPARIFVDSFSPVASDEFASRSVDVVTKGTFAVRGSLGAPVKSAVLASSVAWFSQVAAAINALSPGAVTAPAPTLATKLESE